MIKKHIVIFASSEKQASWSLKYLAANPDKTVKIIASTIPAQLVLLKDNYYPFDFLKIIQTPKNHNAYSPNSENTMSLSMKITKEIIEITKKSVTYKNIPIMEIYKYLIYEEIEKIFFSYEQLKKLFKIWSPEKVYIEKSNEYIKDIALKLYPRKVFLYEIKERNDLSKDLKNLIVKKIPTIENVFGNLLNIYLQTKYNNHLKKKLNFIFHSGGSILNYYYDILKKIHTDEPYLPFLLLAFKQNMKDNINLLNHQVPSLIILNKSKNKKNNIDITFNLDKKTRYLDKFDINLIKLINKKIQSLIQVNLTSIINDINMAEKLLKKYKPKYFITTHEPGPSSQPFILLAKRLGIKTMLMQHGLYRDINDTLYESDKAIVWGEESKRLLKSKLNKNNVYLLNFPIFNNKTIKTNVEKHHKKIFSLLLTLYKPRDIYLSKFLYDLFSGLSKIQDKIAIRIRTHTGQNTEGYLDLADYCNISDISIENRITLDEFVKESDIILSMDTTALLWCMFYKKPLIHTTPWWGNPLLPTTKYKAAWIPKNPQDVVNKITEVMNNPKAYKDIQKGQKDFLVNFTGGKDIDLINKFKKILDNQ